MSVLMSLLGGAESARSLFHMHSHLYLCDKQISGNKEREFVVPGGSIFPRCPVIL